MVGAKPDAPEPRYPSNLRAETSLVDGFAPSPTTSLRTVVIGITTRRGRHRVPPGHRHIKTKATAGRPHQPVALRYTPKQHASPISAYAPGVHSAIVGTAKLANLRRILEAANQGPLAPAMLLAPLTFVCTTCALKSGPGGHRRHTGRTPGPARALYRTPRPSGTNTRRPSEMVISPTHSQGWSGSETPRRGVSDQDPVG